MRPQVHISVTVIWKRLIIKSEQVWNKCCMLVDKMDTRQHLHAASDLDAGQAIYEPTNRE